MKLRLLWTDILRLLAIFGVILLHVAAPFLVPFEPAGAWWIGNFYDSLTRWSVPLLVMVSGALILPEAEKSSLGRFLLVRGRRILIPFLSWSAIYFLYRIQIKGHLLEWTDFVRLLLAGPVYYHLWFIYMLLVLYLLAPAASVFLRAAPPKLAWYLLAFWFFWTALLPVLERLFALETFFSPGLNDYSALRLSGYFLLGSMLRDFRVRSGWQFVSFLLLLAGGGAATIFGTYLLSRSQGEFDPFFYYYFSVPVAAMTISLFVLVKSLFHTRREIDENGDERIRMRTPVLLQKLEMSVFGVYLLHALTLELLRDGRLGFTIDHTSLFGAELPLAVGLPVFALSIFSLSLVSTLALRLIPVVRDLFT